MQEFSSLGLVLEQLLPEPPVAIFDEVEFLAELLVGRNSDNLNDKISQIVNASAKKQFENPELPSSHLMASHPKI